MLPGGVCETQRVCGVAVFLVAHLLLFFNSYLNFLWGGLVVKIVRVCGRRSSSHTGFLFLTLTSSHPTHPLTADELFFAITYILHLSGPSLTLARASSSCLG